jgi:uncharacterized repeat protein (TIGR01451 family)/MYXO-CTERM domain-containing protein
MRRRILGLGVLFSVLATSPAAAQQQFKSGSLIIPMDTTYQDSGMLRASGLLYQLLKGGVPVHWVIKAKKQLGDADLTTSSKDLKSGASIASHGYRGGPFVIEDTQASKATPIVAAWQVKYPATAVHIAQLDFSARSGRLLTAAPTIAVIADGKEDIAFAYMNAASIPDRNGNVWSKSSPDVLDTTEVAGPTTTKHDDGALFRPSGQPAYCQIMTMHWGVNNVVDEVVAEYRSFLGFPTHMMAECQAVNAIENNIFGHFITTSGFLIDNTVNDTGPFEFLNLDTPFAQMDGPYNLVGGSERAYSLPAGGQYYDQNVVMIKDAATTLGQRSIWMTGYLDGKCTVNEDAGPGSAAGCTAGVGKVSYLGGHQYSVTLPVSTHPDTQGTRLFLNSLFEAGCATGEGQPHLTLTKSGPAWTTSGTVTYTLVYANSGPGPALDLVLKDTLPPGATYLSSTGGGVAAGSTLSWAAGDVGVGGAGSVQLTVSFSSYGTYVNTFAATVTVGASSLTEASNSVTTIYQATPPPDSGSLPPADAAPADGTMQPKDSAGGTSDGGGRFDGNTGADAGGGGRDGAGAGRDGPTDVTGGGRDTRAAGDGADGASDSHSGATRDGGTTDTGSVDRSGSSASSESGCNCDLGGEGSAGSPWLAFLGVALAGLCFRRRRQPAARPG